MTLESQVADLTVATTNLTSTVILQQAALDTRIQTIIGAAPAALDTLGEIAVQLASDQDAAGVLTMAVATKAPQSSTYTKTEVDNLLLTYIQTTDQKILTENYVLSMNDAGVSFFIANGTANITITIPFGLPGKMRASFIQQGTGDVTFVPSGTILHSTYNMFKIKGQNYGAYIEGIDSTNVYQIVGKMKL